MRFDIFGDNPVMRGLSKLCDLLILNVLWLICSIPLFTIGASTTAMFAVTLKMAKNEEGYIVKGFFAAFKENFKKSTLIWLMIAFVAIIIIINVQVMSTFSDMLNPIIGTILRGIYLLMGVILLFLTLYVFPMMARYESTIKQSLKNALLIALARLPYTLLLALIVVVPVIVTFLTGTTIAVGILVWVLLGFAVVAWLQSKVLRRVFKLLDEQVEATSQTEEDEQQPEEPS